MDIIIFTIFLFVIGLSFIGGIAWMFLKDDLKEILGDKKK